MRTKQILWVISGLVVGALVMVNVLQADESASSGDSSNQPATNAPVHSHRLTPDQIAKQLGLNDDAAAKLKAVMADAKSQIESLRNQEGLSPTDKQAKFKAIQEDTLAKLSNFLTPEQLQKFKKLVHTPLQRIRRAVTGNTPAPGGATN